MTKSKTTRRALLSSCVALMLCFSMLLGTTYAWFTDTASTSVNMIQAGTLKVDLVSGENSVKEGTLPSLDFTNVKDETDILWEPGATFKTPEFQIVNKGNLHLKYQLVINGITGGNAKLLEAIDFTIGNEDIEAGAMYGQLAPNEATGAMVITGHMDEDAGNEYQGLSIDGITVTVYATQVEAEFDSFGQDYDADADEDAGFDADVWDGTTPSEMPRTLIVDGATQTITVNDAAAFAYLSTLTENWADLYTGEGEGTSYTDYANGAGAQYYYTWQWTVELGANIDLDNQEIEPVDLIAGAAFDGNNYTIKNVKSTGGLFEDNDSHSYSNLTLDTVVAKDGALAGSMNAAATNVTVKNATVSGEKYVGGLVGYIYGNVNSCKVLDSSVIASDKEAGGLIGYIASSTGTNEVTDNLVKNVIVSAGNRAAGLIGQVNVGVTVTENTIDNATIYVRDESEYEASYVVSNALAPENVYNNTVLNCGEEIEEGNALVLHEESGLLWNGNSANHQGVYYVFNASDLEKAADYFAGQAHSNEANKATFELRADIDLSGTDWEPWSVMFITVNGNGHTLSNLSNSLFGYAGAVTIEDLTLKNVTASGNQAGTFAASAEGTTMNDCVLEGDNEVTYVDAGKNENGVGAITGVAVQCDLNVTIANGATVELNKGNIADTEKTTFESNLYGYKHTTYATNSGTITNYGTVTVNSVASTADELVAALKSGADVVLSESVKMEAAATAPYGNKYGVALNGGVLDGGNNKLDIECYGDDYGIMTTGGTVKNLTIEEGCRAIMIMYPTEDIILDNVIIGGDGVLYPINTGEAGSEGVELIVTNSTLAGWTSYSNIESASFTNVEFKQGTYYNNIYGRVLKPYVNTTLTGCSFIEHMNLDLSGLAEGQKVTFEDCTVNGQAVTAEVFTVPATDAEYDTELFTVDLPSWATSVNDCVIFD